MHEDGASIYEVPVDPDAENNCHAYLLSCVGYNKSVLEVGCSTGYLTKVMVERGCEVVGIERDPEAALAAEAWAERVVVGDIDEGAVWNDVKDESFDVLLLGDVLEHLRDPLASLRHAVRKLKPSGYVITSLPNVAHGDVRLSLMLGRFEYNDTGLLDRTHLRFFTAETARQLHADAGLSIVDTKRVIVPLFHSEIDLKREDVRSQTVDDVLADPEAETYEFVIKSVRDNGTQALARLTDRLDELSEHVHYESVRTALLRKKARDYEALVVFSEEQQRSAEEQLRFAEEQQRYIDALKGHVMGLEHNVQVLNDALEKCEGERAAVSANYEAVLSMRTVQLTAPIRWLYNRFFQTKTHDV
jgi:2-polyprenyl-3-methyl-5-hydroxy-6-metoxy-1,4-benzoquinol methylase